MGLLKSMHLNPLRAPPEKLTFGVVPWNMHFFVPLLMVGKVHGSLSIILPGLAGQRVKTDVHLVGREILPLA